MSLHAVFAPEAEGQLDELYRYIADRATAQIADRYVTQVIDYCEGLGIYPTRGSA